MSSRENRRASQIASGTHNIGPHHLSSKAHMYTNNRASESFLHSPKVVLYTHSTQFRALFFRLSCALHARLLVLWHIGLTRKSWLTTHVYNYNLVIFGHVRVSQERDSLVLINKMKCLIVASDNTTRETPRMSHSHYYRKLEEM